MLRLSIKVCGYLALIGAMLSVAVAIREVGGATGPGPAGAMRVSEHIRNAGIMGAIWLVCLAAAQILDFVGHRLVAVHDPYEAHPKMSPSVQPVYVSQADFEP